MKNGESGPAKSPDGKFVYYDKGYPNNYSVWRVPTSGGEETQVIELPAVGGWEVVDDGIFFISKPDDKGVSYIRFKNLTTNELRTIAPIKGVPWWGLTVSPDRHTFLYAQSDDDGSDLMLVENFR